MSESVSVRKKTVRESPRKLLFFYDIVILAIVWMAAFVFHPSAVSLDFAVCALHFLISAFLFTLFRAVFRVYRQIWRYGSVSAYAREAAASACAGVCYVAAVRFFPALGITFISSVAYALIYAGVCLIIRILYFYVFRFLRRDTRLSRTLKKLLRPLTLVDFDSPEEGGLLHLMLEPDLPSALPVNPVIRVVEGFAVPGEVVSVQPITKGYINQTFYVEMRGEDGTCRKYLLQKINTSVFRDVDLLMDNYKYVTDRLLGTLHLEGARPEGCVQTLHVTRDGRNYLRADDGCYRLMDYFDGVYSLDIPDSPTTFRNAGAAFGRFLRAASEIDKSRIGNVLPDYRNTVRYYGQLEAAIEADVKKRAAKVRKEIDFYRRRAANFGLITDALAMGRIPYRVCHNDCNLNNILFDSVTGLPVAIIDLDTVMPLSPLCDFGDSIRVGTNTAKDDEKDLSRVSFDIGLFEQYARGYLSEAGGILTASELELLPLACLVVTSEDGIRFLADHISGDTYYNIFYPGQNLDRCRTQMKLLECMERALPDIVRVLNGIYSELGLGVKLDPEEVVSEWTN